MLIQSSPLQSMPLVLLTLLLYWGIRVASLILARTRCDCYHLLRWWRYVAQSLVLILELAFKWL
jgi:hypothetical protein